MRNRHRIHLVWAPRRETPAALGARLHRCIEALAGLELSGWRTDAGALGSEADCVTAIERGAVPWQLGGSEHVAHEVHAFLGRSAASAATLSIVAGAEPMGELFTPNRLDLRIPDAAATLLVHEALVAAAAVFQADFGHAGSERVPEPPQPLFSPGIPAVGWMTWLSRSYPAVPARLPAPAVAYGAAGGTLVVAHPKPFREHAREQREALAAVEATLRGAGVLVPFATISRRAGADAPPRAVRSADPAQDHV